MLLLKILLGGAAIAIGICMLIFEDYWLKGALVCVLGVGLLWSAFRTFAGH